MKAQGVKAMQGVGEGPWAGTALGDVYKMTFSYTLERKKGKAAVCFQGENMMPAWLCMAQGSAPSRTQAKGGLAASTALGRGTAWLLGAELSSGDGHSVPDSLSDSLAQRDPG